MRSRSERAKNAVVGWKEIDRSDSVSLNWTRFTFFFKAMASLTFENFSTWWTPGWKKQTQKQRYEKCSVSDMDGNGFIGAEEFKWTMMNLHNQLTEEEVNEIIKTADLNGDGQIDLKGNFNFFFCFVLFFLCPVFYCFIDVWSFRLFLLACQFCLHMWYNNWLTLSLLWVS